MPWKTSESAGQLKFIDMFNITKMYPFDKQMILGENRFIKQVPAMLPNTNCTVCTYPTQRKTLEIQAY
jgi:hypothetical protein